MIVLTKKYFIIPQKITYIFSSEILKKFKGSKNV